MTTRPLSFALLAGLLLPLNAPAPTTLKYKVTQSLSQTVDATALGGGVQDLDATFDVFFTLTYSDSADVRAVSGTVDSVVPRAGANEQMLAQVNSQLKGASGSGYIDTEGKVKGFESGTALSVRGLVQAVFPKVKKGAKPGDDWTDTTTSVDTTPAGTTTRNVTAHFTAAPGDSWNGKPTLKVTASSSYTISGTVQAGALEGNGNQTATFSLAPAGHVIHAESQDNSNLSLTISQSPEPVPIVSKNSSVVTLLQ